jgi:hypothetical protein
MGKLPLRPGKNLQAAEKTTGTTPLTTAPRNEIEPGWLVEVGETELSFTSPRTRLHMAERLREEACLPRASHTDTKNSTPSWNKADCLTESKNPNQETPTQEP